MIHKLLRLIKKHNLIFEKRIKHLALFYIFLLRAAFPDLQAQVVIGENTDPQSYSILELISNGNKGLRLPRLTTQERDRISKDPTFANVKKDLARGLIIYNLDTDCEDFWNGDEWKSLCGSPGKADFTIPDCSLIQVNGMFYNNKSLTADNYLTVPVNVTKPGTYQIKIVPDPANGYYFIASGEFLSVGPAEIIVSGYGTPINHTPNGGAGDRLVILLNGVDLNCTNKPHIKIGNTTVRPKFGITCKTLTVNGMCKKNRPLDNSNYVTIRIEVQSGSQGAEWIVETNEIDGIRFKGSGILGPAGPQNIILYGEGTTHTSNEKVFTVTTNSEISSASCCFTIVPVMAEKKIVEFGYNYGKTYGLASKYDGGGPEPVLTDNMNFGKDVNSIVYYEGFSNIVHSNTQFPKATELKRYTAGDSPYDIIIFTYDAKPYDIEACDELVSYLDRGGVVIHLDQGIHNKNTDLVRRVFGMANMTSTSIGKKCNQVIRITDTVDDEITNGPFGDVRGKGWGEDFDNSVGLTTLPTDAIVYSAAINGHSGTNSDPSVKATMLRHPTKSYFWCGDSGLIHAAKGTEAGTTAPFSDGPVIINGITYPHYPIAKNGYGNGISVSVYNSTLFANLMAWALRMAEDNGINSKP
jgi:hypothetical protein